MDTEWEERGEVSPSVCLCERESMQCGKIYTIIYRFRGWYSKAANTILTKFLKYSGLNHMAFLAGLYDANTDEFSPYMDHLSCFAPGMLALGYLHGFPEAHLEVAKNLTHTCYELYHQSPSGLSPDVVVFYTTKSARVDFSSRVCTN